MAKRIRRVHEEEIRAERRPRLERERPATALGGPAREVLRLQRLAGNSAVQGLMHAPALQRDDGSAPAPTEERPKESGIEIIVEDERIGSFVALSVHHSSTPSGASGTGKRVPTEVVITKSMDKLSPILHQRAATGRSFPTVTIQFPGMPLVLNDVVISSYTVSDSAHGNGPIEVMTFSGKEPEEEK